MKNTYKKRKTKTEKRINNKTKKSHKKGGNETTGSQNTEQTPKKLNLSKYKKVDNFLKKAIICGINNECLNFGINKRLDFLLFSNFEENRKYISDISRLSEGNNGNVYSIKFIKTFEENNKSIDLTFDTILKTSKNILSDNLVYEYIVGRKFINYFASYYPNLVLTYGMFNIFNEDFDKENISNSLEHINDNTINNLKQLIKHSCAYPTSVAIMTQNFTNCETFHNFVVKIKRSEDYQKIKELFTLWIPIILYQIYFMLSDMANVFTHYDLHSNNVLIYKLPEGKYVNMNYINDDGKTIVSFKTIYIPKIIDYGRSYFYVSDHFNSKIIHDKILCNVEPCNKSDESETCGNKSGYKLFSYDYRNQQAYPQLHYISSSLKNISHDLRLAYIILMDYIRGIHMADKLYDLLSEIKYEEQYGTPEVFEDYFGIENVNDMVYFLEHDIMNTPIFNEDLDNFFTQSSENYTCLGTLNIYKKRRRQMDFIPE